MIQFFYFECFVLFDINMVFDVFDFFGLFGVIFGLCFLWDCLKIVGCVSIIQFGFKMDVKFIVYLIMFVVEVILMDDCVLVIVGGVEGILCWGDILVNVVIVKRVCGLVIDGLSCDIEGSEFIGYLVYGCGIMMISVCNWVIQIDFGKFVQMVGVIVYEDDYVIVDCCGMVFVFVDCIEEVFDFGECIVCCQDGMVVVVCVGCFVVEVMYDKEFEVIVVC